MSEHSQSFTNRKLLVARKAGPQRFTLDERHREIRRAVDLTRREQGDDVRMLELRGELNLSSKAIEAYACCKLRLENLYDNLSLERNIQSHEHSTHATAAELAVEGVNVAERSLERLPQVGGWLPRLVSHSGKVAKSRGGNNSLHVFARIKKLRESLSALKSPSSGNPSPLYDSSGQS